MKFETRQNLSLPKIGYGTWRIGGNSSPNHSLDSKSLTALRTALEVGYTHFDTAEMYASGHSETLLGQAIHESGIPRDSLFITSKVMPSNLKYAQVLNACAASLQRLGMDHVDLYLIHWPGMGTKYEETFRALNKLVREGRAKHLGVSNFNLRLLRQAQELSETPILTDQVSFSVSDHSYIKNGVLEYCRQNEILLTAYSPVDEGRLRPNKALEAVARSQKATIHQIALAWVIAHPGVITIPMSFNPRHIRENFEAAEIELTRDEIDQITQLG